MQKIRMEQKTERRISAALRLVLVAVLLVAQIALVWFLSDLLQQHIAAAYTVLELLAIVYAVRIYSSPGSNTYKPGWILLILAVPVVGLILYWLWNGDHPDKRLSLKKVSKITDDADCTKSEEKLEQLRREMPAWSRLAGYLNRQGFALHDSTRVSYFPTGEALLENMLEEMERAEHFIFMEYYIIASGVIWQRMMDIFRRKAEKGVEVKIIYDDFGSMMRLPPEQLSQLREIGVEIRAFNPVHHYVNRLYFNYRDHRKITCIDGNIAYTGGANIADEYANLIERFGYWKDCGVCLQGEGAWGATREFIYQWERLGGTLISEADFYRPDAASSASGYCQFFTDGPDKNPIFTAEEVFLQLISGAKREITITTPYFAISEPMMRALCLAGDSGIDVRLLVPGIPDHRLAFWVAESYFGELISHGVKVMRFKPGLLHGKSVVVDDEVAFVGSVNMDYRSFQLHFECGVVLFGMPSIQEIRQDMECVEKESHLLSYGEWSRRIWYRRLLEPVLRLFAMWI